MSRKLAGWAVRERPHRPPEQVSCSRAA
jgi:hypothetical protein